MVTVLVVEDDKNLRKLMEVVLRQNGYNVLTATDGLQSLEILDKQQVDLLISDIMMPNMDGYSLTEEIRKLKITCPF